MAPTWLRCGSDVAAPERSLSWTGSATVRRSAHVAPAPLSPATIALPSSCTRPSVLGSMCSRNPVAFLPHQLVKQRHEPQVVCVPDDSAILDDRLCLSHGPTFPVQPAPSNRGAFALSPRSSSVSRLAPSSYGACISSMEGTRNLIACYSDVAGIRDHTDFSCTSPRPDDRPIPTASPGVAARCFVLCVCGIRAR